jgi:hypothetical protein
MAYILSAKRDSIDPIHHQTHDCFWYWTTEGMMNATESTLIDFISLRFNSV